MAQNPFRLLELLEQAFGKSFVNKTIGTGTNVVKPTKFDINAPTKELSLRILLEKEINYYL